MIWPEVPEIQKGGKSKVLKWRLYRIRRLKIKRELPPTTTGNPENKTNNIVRAQYSTDRKREASWQQAKERKRKMNEHRNYKICIEDWTETREWENLFAYLHEAEREAKERKLNAEISISIKLSKSKVTFH